MKIMEWLKLPEIRDCQNLDDLSTALLHKEIIQKKVFLKRLYSDFYMIFRNSISDIETKYIVELGSGSGFIKEIIPHVVTSDVLPLPNIDKYFSALKMPFEDGTVDAFFMINVLHHLSDVRTFFKEACRCLKVCGKIIMIEPAKTLWSQFIYRNFHHELFDPSGEWELEYSGPLSSANDALPYIIFYRDRDLFEQEFPSLKILKLLPHTPFRYLVSGGVSMRQLLPEVTYPIIKGIETMLSPLNRYLGMFLTIELLKREK